MNLAPLHYAGTIGPIEKPEELWSCQVGYLAYTHLLSLRANGSAYNKLPNPSPDRVKSQWLEAQIASGGGFLHKTERISDQNWKREKEALLC